MARDLVLVTGGAGFIGSNIACMLADRHDVVVCDPLENEGSWRYLAAAGIHDVICPEDALRWLRRNQGEVYAVVHMGAISATTETDVSRIVASNVRCTLDLWEWCAQDQITFIYASSAATYGDGARGFVDDDNPEALARLRPLNAYAWSKSLVDRRVMADVVRGRPAPPRWAGLKFFNVYGPNESHKGSMRSLVHQMYPVAAAGGVVKLFKSDNAAYRDGGQLRDFVYVKDCVSVVDHLMRADRVAGIFNLGTGKARTFDDLAKAVFRAIGAEPRIQYVDMPQTLKGRYQYFTEADVTKLKASGLAPRFHELEDGVEDYVRHHLAPEREGT